MSWNWQPKSLDQPRSVDKPHFLFFLTFRWDGENLFRDVELIFRCSGPVLHAPPALHGEVDIAGNCWHWFSLNGYHWTNDIWKQNPHENSLTRDTGKINKEYWLKDKNQTKTIKKTSQKNTLLKVDVLVMCLNSELLETDWNQYLDMKKSKSSIMHSKNKTLPTEF